MEQNRKKKLSELTFLEKVEHIWEYYKPAIFGIVLLIALIIYIIVKILSPDPETIMNATLINANAYGVEVDTAFDAFMEQEGFDTDTQEVTVNASLFLDMEGMSQSDMASYQALMAQLMVGEIDVLAGDESVFERIGSGGALMPVSDFLSEDILEKYQDKVYTVKDMDTDEEITCGIWVTSDDPLTKDGYYGDKYLLGIPYTTERQELAIAAVLYLLGE